MSSTSTLQRRATSRGNITGQAWLSPLFVGDVSKGLKVATVSFASIFDSLAFAFLLAILASAACFFASYKPPPSKLPTIAALFSIGAPCTSVSVLEKSKRHNSGLALRLLGRHALVQTVIWCTGSFEVTPSQVFCSAQCYWPDQQLPSCTCHQRLSSLCK